jgi:hypothetical protein
MYGLVKRNFNTKIHTFEIKFTKKKLHSHAFISYIHEIYKLKNKWACIIMQYKYIHMLWLSMVLYTWVYMDYLLTRGIGCYRCWMLSLFTHKKHLSSFPLVGVHCQACKRFLELDGNKLGNENSALWVDNKLKLNPI